MWARESNWNGLRKRGIPGKLIVTIRARNDDAKFDVLLHRCKICEEFEVQSEVLFLAFIADVIYVALTSTTLLKSLGREPWPNDFEFE